MKFFSRQSLSYRWMRFVFIIPLTGLLLWGSAVFAQNEKDEKTATEEILEILKDKGEISDSQYEALKKKAESERESDTSAINPYWKEGFGFKNEIGDFEIEIGGRIMLDWASISADDKFDAEIEAAEGDPLEGDGVEFRRARLFVAGTIYDSIVFKAQYDFAGGDPEFKDVFLGLTNVPAIGNVMVGHFKEPFSIEEQTSSKYITFMERSLPVNAFSPGRNTGLMIFDSFLNERMSWALGTFYETDDFGNDFDDITDVNVTGRITGAPVYADEGRKVVHLGLTYSHRFRDEDEEDAGIRYRVRPSTHITDARLANTGDILVDDVDLVDLEAAMVWGPFSLQGEYISAFVSSEAADDPTFSGYYVYGSYFLTGEHRDYKPGSGEFSRINPINNFSPTGGGAGAWEVGLRYASVDLTDEDIEGGELSDITLGVNWHLNPNVRMMFNYVYADLEDRADVSDDDANIFQARFQIDW